MSAWEIVSQYHLNTATAKEVGISLPEWPDDKGETRATGTYRQVMALAKQLRWEWISYNGYNAIRVQRGYTRLTRNRQRMFVMHYQIWPHFGMLASLLCTIRRVE